MPFFRKQAYKIVGDNDESKSFLIQEPYVPKPRSRSSWVLHSLSLVLNVLLASTVLIQAFRPQLLRPGFLMPRRSESQKVVTDFTYHPATFDTVVKTINGTLFPSNNPSWSRLAPSPMTDDLWEWYETRRYISLSETDIIKLGRNPADIIPLEEGWGGAPANSYLGSLDVFHKIHCLNMLRKSAFQGHPQSTQERQNDDMDWIHLRHCVDQLAQDLQCNAKPDVILLNWMDTQENPFPNFNIDRTCTNWDQFLDWSEKNTINPLNVPLLKRPQGVATIPAEDGYYERFGFAGSIFYPGGAGYKKQI